MAEGVVSVVFAGHVDHGKSTIVGRLMADSGNLPEGKLEQVQDWCEKNSKPMEYAFLIDAFKAEQAQGITIDTARVFYKGAQGRNFLVMDAPGHIEFLKNMITGASRADGAFLVIDASEGVRENSRRHGYMASLLGIRQIGVVVNKMDKENYSEEIFTKIRDEYFRFLSSIGVEPMFIIPASGINGDNVYRKSTNMPWYSGYTVAEAMEQYTRIGDYADRPLRMPVQDVYKFTSEGDERRILAGRITSGVLRKGDEILISPEGTKTKIKSIETFPDGELGSSGYMDSTGFTTEDPVYARRGDMVSLAAEEPPMVSDTFKASIFWLGKKPIGVDGKFTFRLGSKKIIGRITDIQRVIDSSDLNHSSERKAVERNEVAECIIKLDEPAAFDTVTDFPHTGRFVMVRDYEIMGGGIILEPLYDEESGPREQAGSRAEVSIADQGYRFEKIGHKGAIIVLTGGISRRIGDYEAMLIERKMFAAAITGSSADAAVHLYSAGCIVLVKEEDADIEGVRDHCLDILEFGGEIREDIAEEMGELLFLLGELGISE
ncbi:sulfate adenylyltransferase subunit 1 [Limisalsivibrio acetivorans]|uniref:sulfate adenylyltransferase subunit 1 n=1 Tax=Limisalsivibrio acetivorans TaxID=1304888 RepID=UPI0003B32903|nr:GTP-binding protein [Limisalsivibrio acetivorans]